MVRGKNEFKGKESETNIKNIIDKAGRIKTRNKIVEMIPRILVKVINGNGVRLPDKSRYGQTRKNAAKSCFQDTHQKT